MDITSQLISAVISILTSLLILLIGRRMLAERDRQIQEAERSRVLFRSLRAEFVAIYNHYYAARKRYTTLRDTLVGKRVRNPYFQALPEERRNMRLDKLSLNVIGLEGRYFTLVEQLKIGFPELWNNHLKPLMQRDKTDKGSDISIENYFHEIRRSIEENLDITADLKTPLEERFVQIVKILNDHEGTIIARQKGLW
jgi:hypothetical protein